MCGISDEGINMGTLKNNLLLELKEAETKIKRVKYTLELIGNDALIEDIKMLNMCIGSLADVSGDLTKKIK